MPYLNIGTDGAQNLKIKNTSLGRFESNLIFGRMIESEYFDDNSGNNNRYFNSVHLSYSPSFARELSIGFNKVLYKQSRYWETKDLLALVHNEFNEVKIVNGDSIFSPNDFFDQMASVTLEWKFADKGFRVYGEYAVNDHSEKDLEPEHSRAYTLGFQKLFEFNNINLVLNYEHIVLSRNHTFRYRPEPSYYQHYLSNQGYTNNGQIMGSATGTGGNADIIEIKFNRQPSNHTFGVFYRRTEYDKDYFITHDPDLKKHHIGMDYGINNYFEFQNLILGQEFVYTNQYNRYFQEGNNKQNIYAAINLIYKLNEK